jgi:hypothetical protein
VALISIRARRGYLLPLLGDYRSVAQYFGSQRATLAAERSPLSFATPPRGSGGRSWVDNPTRGFFPGSAVTWCQFLPQSVLAAIDTFLMGGKCGGGRFDARRRHQSQRSSTFLGFGTGADAALDPPRRGLGGRLLGPDRRASCRRRGRASARRIALRRHFLVSNRLERGTVEPHDYQLALEAPTPMAQPQVRSEVSAAGETPQLIALDSAAGTPLLR